jgi:HAD superfamily hydrolase (TIGR01509 family)
MVEAFLFDLDGTLVDTGLANFKAYKAAFKKNNISICDTTLRKCIGVMTWKEMMQLVSPGISLDLATRVANYKQFIYKDYFVFVEINVDLINLIKNIKNDFKVGLVTSASKKSTFEIIKWAKIANLFDVIITGDDCVLHKPDPGPYILAGNLLGVSPDRCLVFEDSATGIQSAKDFGANVVPISWAKGSFDLRMGC